MPLRLSAYSSGKTTVLINRIANLLTYGRGSDCGEVPAGASEDDIAFLENYPAQPTADERRRMRQLCAVEPPAPWQVLAVTFTNKAAKELRERLEAFGIAGDSEGYIRYIVEEIQEAIGQEKDPYEACHHNVRHSMHVIENSLKIQAVEHDYGVKVMGAIYDIETGKVDFLQDNLRQF